MCDSYDSSVCYNFTSVHVHINDIYTRFMQYSRILLIMFRYLEWIAKEDAQLKSILYVFYYYIHVEGIKMYNKITW